MPTEAQMDTILYCIIFYFVAKIITCLQAGYLCLFKILTQEAGTLGMLGTGAGDQEDMKHSATNRQWLWDVLFPPGTLKLSGRDSGIHLFSKLFGYALDYMDSWGQKLG